MLKLLALPLVALLVLGVCYLLSSLALPKSEVERWEVTCVDARGIVLLKTEIKGDFVIDQDILWTSESSIAVGSCERIRLEPKR